MNAPTTKSALLAQIRAARAEFEAALAQVSPAALTEPGFNGDWTGQDLLAHIFEWEEHMLYWYEAGKTGRPFERPEPGYTWSDIDRLNADLRARHQHRPLEEVLEEFAASYRAITAAIEAMSEDELFSVGYYDWTGDRYPLVVYLRANTDEHYAEHLPQLRAWLTARKD